MALSSSARAQSRSIARVLAQRPQAGSPSARAFFSTTQSRQDGNADTKNLSQSKQTSAVSQPTEAPGSQPSPEIRLPRSVQAAYLRPLRRTAEHGIPSCDLQLRSYSARNLEFFADFALRAAYYLNLPAYGPTPLPRITERWTVPRSNFVNKKSQENFERITLRRLIQIKDGNPETVQIWLAFLRKHAYYGVGMKANIWEFESLDVSKTLDSGVEAVEKVMEPNWALFGRKNSPTADKVVELMNSKKFQAAVTGP